MMKTKLKTKKGAASIYVVVMATLLLSVITVAFIRLIIRESQKSTNDELAQSAYDSALAGVEDAKTALKKYHKNEISAATMFSSSCNAFAHDINQVEEDFDGDGTPDGVKIKESQDGSDTIVQYYTCVTLSNTLKDYRSYLDESTTTRIIPLRSGRASEVAALRISWFSEDDGDFSSLTYSDADSFTPKGRTEHTPPVISAQIIQTDQIYNLSQFDTSSGVGTNRGTVFLVPAKTGTNSVGSDVVIKSNTHQQENDPQKIKCFHGSGSKPEFACEATIGVPPTVSGSTNRLEDTFFLVLSLTYRSPKTNFSVQMLDASGNPIDFKDVQISIDSTGRANDMYSRVETRVIFFDDFTLPEYAVQATGTEDDAIKKDFYVTKDCWVTKTDTSGNWGVQECNNSGEN